METLVWEKGKRKTKQTHTHTNTVCITLHTHSHKNLKDIPSQTFYKWGTWEIQRGWVSGPKACSQ